MKHLLFLFLSTSAVGRDLGSVPIILVHGYGPPVVSSMAQYKRRLIADGVHSKDILMVKYAYNASLDTINTQVNSQISTFMASYAANTQYDIISHSLGGFVGIYSPLQGALSSRMRKFISLAGVAHGQDNLPSFCKFGCGKALPILVPFMNPFLINFYQANVAAIARIKKYALYSPDDALVNSPDDSGAFADGVKVSITDASHEDEIHDPDLYAIMKTTCYGEPAPAGGFKHRWFYDDEPWENARTCLKAITGGDE